MPASVGIGQHGCVRRNMLQRGFTDIDASFLVLFGSVGGQPETCMGRALLPSLPAHLPSQPAVRPKQGQPVLYLT